MDFDFSFLRDECLNLERSLRVDWLETDGLGGYAASTILDMLDVSVATKTSGQSLIPFLRGSSPPGWGDKVYFTESWAKHAMGPGHGMIRFQPPAFSARLGDRKLAFLDASAAD